MQNLGWRTWVLIFCCITCELLVSGVAPRLAKSHANSATNKMLEKSLTTEETSLNSVLWSVTASSGSGPCTISTVTFFQEALCLISTHSQKRKPRILQYPSNLSHGEEVVSKMWATRGVCHDHTKSLYIIYNRNLIFTLAFPFCIFWEICWI